MLFQTRLLAPVAGLALLLSPAMTSAEVKVPSIFSSHMVLQRDQPVPIWGTASAGEKIQVTFRDQSKTTTVNQEGKWSLKLDALKSGGAPDTLTIAGSNTLKFEDVLVGEVWVGSGQSNMQGNAGGYAKGDPVLARLVAGSYPKIRLASARGGWREATPANTPGFSALLFSFGVRLHEKLDVPVGLILGAVGGTPSGPWLSEEAFKQDEALQALIKKLRANYHAEQAKKAFDESLAKWEKAAEQAKKDGTKPPMKPVGPIVPGEPRAKIGSLYETHIRPCVPFGIRGVLWDQGEGGTAVAGVDQYTLMGALIRGWRAEWNQGDFPFLFVQKPSGGGTAWDLTDDVTNQASKFEALPAKPPASTDGLDREVHIRIMKYPNTGIVTTTDLGAGIHPSNKSAYGTRAARVALGMVYGGKEEYYGPVYDSHKVEGNSIRLSFSHVGKGLTFKHGEKLQGFMIAGEDKAFQWGEATIEGNHVVVKSTQVSKPVAVRYAWGRTHAWANLFNQEGLPALTFRTDEW